jgi:hypothetical protein
MAANPVEECPVQNADDSIAASAYLRLISGADDGLVLALGASLRPWRLAV